MKRAPVQPLARPLGVPRRASPALATPRSATLLLAASLLGACASGGDHRAAGRADARGADVVAPPRTPPPADLPASLAGRAAVLAGTLVGVPYRRAGMDPGGFDCSGLVAYVFERLGLALPHSAAAQRRRGDWVPLDEARPGDLLFFSHAGGDVHHVGIVASQPGEPLVMVHASSSQGVATTVVAKNRYWLDRLLGARRVSDF